MSQNPVEDLLAPAMPTSGVQDGHVGGQMAGDAQMTDRVQGRLLNERPGLRLLVERKPRRHNFLGDVAYVLRSKPPLPPSDPAFWSKVLLPSRVPWITFLESLVYHTLVLVVLVALLAWMPRHIQQQDPWKDTKLVYYPALTNPPKTNLPTLDSGSAASHRAQAGSPAYAGQPIISVPRKPDNREQTLVTPPDLVIRRNVRLPNIVAWNTLPSAPAPAVTGLVSERSLKAPDLSVIAPSPELQAVHTHGPILPQTAAIAPPPEVKADARARNPLTLAATIIPPPPQVDPSTRRQGVLDIGRSEVIAPAPQLPVSEQRTLTQATRSRTAAAQALSAAAVPPPPSISTNGTAAPGRVIALSVHPAPPSALAPPAGNRRGEFSATPQGSAQGSGRPTIPESPQNSGRDSGTGASTAIPGIPPGIHVGEASTAPLASGNSDTQTVASISIDRHPIATIPPSRVDIANRKPATLSEHTPTDVERKVFGGRRFYSMLLNMPNLNSAGGSWVLRFAELKDGPSKGELFSPLITLKSDPAYPSELQRANVQGTVTLYAIIHSDGSVGEIRVLDGVDDQLDRFASEALARCRFEPALKDGAPVPLEAVVMIPFRARRAF
jgi:TonB family protein